VHWFPFLECSILTSVYGRWEKRSKITSGQAVFEILVFFPNLFATISLSESWSRLYTLYLTSTDGLLSTCPGPETLSLTFFFFWKNRFELRALLLVGRLSTS
jgi:hypothetical protein